MFSVFSFTDQAISARRRTPSGTKEDLDILSGEQRLVLAREAGVGRREDSLEILHRKRIQLDANGEAPLQLRNQVRRFGKMKRSARDEEYMVGFTIPYLVETVVPSTMGSRSRCTPCRETSAPTVSPRLAILSISSRNTMPFSSTLASALARRSSSLTRRPPPRR